MENLFFFTGGNEYAITREIQRWKQRFALKHGEENFLTLRGREASLSRLLDAVETMPFIAEKRLVVIEGVPKLDREGLEQFSSSIHPQTVVVIVDPKPDKRLGVVKELERQAEMRHFPPLPPLGLLQWITEQAKKEGAAISDATARALIAMVGEDQWTLESEISKLALYAKNGEITVAYIEIVCVPSGTQVLWHLTDLIGNKKSHEALRFLERRLERGEDPYGIWTILLNMVKNLMIVAAAMEAGHQSERSIADATGLHFLAVRGVMPLARGMPLKRVRELVDFAADADLQLKSGGYHYSAEHPEEVIALAERMILSCS